MRVAIALLGGLVCMVEAALASNWVYLTDTDNAQVFIDTESIAVRDGKVKAWFLFEYGGPQTDAGQKRRNIYPRNSLYTSTALSGPSPSSRTSDTRKRAARATSFAATPFPLRKRLSMTLHPTR